MTDPITDVLLAIAKPIAARIAPNGKGGYEGVSVEDLLLLLNASNLRIEQSLAGKEFEIDTPLTLIEPTDYNGVLALNWSPILLNTETNSYLWNPSSDTLKVRVRTVHGLYTRTLQPEWNRFFIPGGQVQIAGPEDWAFEGPSRANIVHRYTNRSPL